MPPLVLALWFLGQAPPPMPPDEVVHQFYVRKVAGDAPGAAALWSARREEITREVETLGHARCTRLLSFRVDDLQIDGDRATASAAATLAMTSAMPGAKEHIELDSARFTLRRAN